MPESSASRRFHGLLLDSSLCRVPLDRTRLAVCHTFEAASVLHNLLELGLRIGPTHTSADPPAATATGDLFTPWVELHKGARHISHS
eukprot:5011208-Amphidinium_carterae.1